MLAIHGYDSSFLHQIWFMHIFAIIPPSTYHAGQGMATILINVKATLRFPFVFIDPNMRSVFG